MINKNSSSLSLCKSQSHKYDENAFRTYTPKLTNQNVDVVGYVVLIGCFASIRANLVLKSFMTMRRPALQL